MRAQMSWIAAISGRLTTAVHSIPVPNAAPATAYVVTPLGSSSAAPVTRPGPSVRKYRTSGLWLSLSGSAFAFIEHQRGGAAHGEALVARHDRDARRRQGARESVLGGGGQDALFQRGQGRGHAARHDHDLRVEPVHDRREHRAERATRLVHHRRRDGLTVGGGAKDELGGDPIRRAAGKREQRRLDMAGDARPGGFRDAAPARIDRQTAAPAAPARRTVELHRRVAELAPEAGDAAHQPAVEDDAGAESRTRCEYDE